MIHAVVILNSATVFLIAIQDLQSLRFQDRHVGVPIMAIVDQRERHGPRNVSPANGSPPATRTGVFRSGRSAVPDVNDLTFDVDDFNLAAHVPYSVKSSRAGSRRKNIPDKKKGRPALLCLISFIFLAAAMSLSFIPKNDLYIVETRLHFIYENKNNLWPVDKEIEILKKPTMIFAVGDQVPGTDKALQTEPKEWRTEATAHEQGKAISHGNDTAYGIRLASRLSENLQVEPIISADRALVRLQLSGEDPEYLKQTLNSYVKKFAEYRRAVEEEAANLNNSSRSQEHSGNVSEQLTDQIQKLDIQLRECELAMKIPANRKGVFSGFIPGGTINAVPALAHFQDKIVKLEINKRALSVHFTGASREIRNIDAEIGEMKNAMRECLGEHLHFLQKSKEILLTKKQEVDARRAESSEKKSQCMGAFPNGDTWFFINTGLHIIQDQPVVARRPIAQRAKEYWNALPAYLSFPLGNAPFNGGNGENGGDKFLNHQKYDRPGEYLPAQTVSDEIPD